MEQKESRLRLARQLAAARHDHGWRLFDLARRTGRNPGRLSEMETGKANSTLDSLSEVGEALGLTLVFVPRDKLDAVLALTGSAPNTTPVPQDVPSAFEELFVRPPEDGTEGDGTEEDDHARS